MSLFWIFTELTKWKTADRGQILSYQIVEGLSQNTRKCHYINYICHSRFAIFTAIHQFFLPNSQFDQFFKQLLDLWLLWQLNIITELPYITLVGKTRTWSSWPCARFTLGKTRTWSSNSKWVQHAHKTVEIYYIVRSVRSVRHVHVLPRPRSADMKKNLLHGTKYGSLPIENFPRILYSARIFLPKITENISKLFWLPSL
jgi:hypothetical protein